MNEVKCDHISQKETLLSIAERCSSYHLNYCHIVSFRWGRTQLITSGWVQRIPIIERWGALAVRVVFGLGCSGDPHICSEYRRALQEGFDNRSPLSHCSLSDPHKPVSLFVLRLVQKCWTPGNITRLQKQKSVFVKLVNKFPLSNMLPSTGQPPMALIISPRPV